MGNNKEISKAGTGASGTEFRTTQSAYSEQIIGANKQVIGHFLWDPSLGGKLMLDLFVPVTSMVRVELPALEDIVVEGQRIREALSPQEKPQK